MPMISVIMNCFNGERYLRTAIESVFVQTWTDWEIVFWDNCSTDGTAEIAQLFGSRVRYFRGERNLLLGAARVFLPSLRPVVSGSRSWIVMMNFIRNVFPGNRWLFSILLAR